MTPTRSSSSPSLRLIPPPADPASQLRGDGKSSGVKRSAATAWGQSPIESSTQHGKTPRLGARQVALAADAHLAMHAHRSVSPPASVNSGGSPVSSEGLSHASGSISAAPARESSDVGDSSEIEHEDPVSIKAGSEVRVARAIFADMNEGLAIAMADGPDQGVCSLGFATCYALVLKSSNAIGLEHTSMPVEDLPEDIEAALQRFTEETGTKGELFAIGYGLNGYRDDLRQEAKSQSLSAEAFAKSHGYTGSITGTTEEEKMERVIQSILDGHQRETTAFARKRGIPAFEMPHGALYVDLQGYIDVFSELATEPEFAAL